METAYIDHEVVKLQRNQIAVAVVCVAAILAQGLGAWGSVHLVHQHKIARRYLQWLNVLLAFSAVGLIWASVAMASSAAQMVDELQITVYALITVGSFLVIVSMLDCVAAWQDDASLVKRISDLFMYLVTLVMGICGLFLVIGSRDAISRWVEAQQIPGTDGAPTGSVQLLEFQAFSEAGSVDEAVTVLEQEGEVLGLLTLGVTWLLLVGLLSEWELKSYLGVTCCGRKSKEGSPKRSRKSSDKPTGICCCLHPSSWSARCSQLWVKHASFWGMFLCCFLLVAVMAATLAAFWVPSPDLQTVDGGTARITLVIEQNLDKIPVDTQLRTDFRSRVNQEVSSALSIQIDAVVSMEIEPYVSGGRRQLSMNSSQPSSNNTDGATTTSEANVTIPDEATANYNHNLAVVTLFILPSVLNESSTTKYADEFVRLHESGLFEENVYPILSRLQTIEYIIIDEAVVGHGSIQFRDNVTHIHGIEREVLVVITREGKVDGRAVTARYHTVPGTARPGQHFVPSSGVVVFPPDVTQKTIAIKLIQGSQCSLYAVQFSVALGSVKPTNEAVLGSPLVTTISIGYEDEPVHYASFVSNNSVAKSSPYDSFGFALSAPVWSYEEDRFLGRNFSRPFTLTVSAHAQTPTTLRIRFLNARLTKQSVGANYLQDGFYSFEAAVAPTEVPEELGILIGDLELTDQLTTFDLHVTSEMARQLDDVRDISLLVAPDKLWTGWVAFTMFNMLEEGLPTYEPKELYSGGSWWGWNPSEFSNVVSYRIDACEAQVLPTDTTEYWSNVFMQNSTVYVDASELFVEVTLVREGKIERAATVDCVTEDRTGLSGVHFVARETTVFFEPHETRKTVTVGLISGRRCTLWPRSFQVTLSNAQPSSEARVLVTNDTTVVYVNYTTLRFTDIFPQVQMSKSGPMDTFGFVMKPPVETVGFGLNLTEGFKIRVTARASSTAAVQVRLKSLGAASVDGFEDDGLRSFGAALQEAGKETSDAGFLVGEIVLDQKTRTQEISATADDLLRYSRISGNVLDRVYEVSFLVAPYSLWSGTIDFSMMGLQETSRTIGYRPEELYHQAMWWGWDGGVQKSGGQVAYVGGNAVLWGNDGWLGPQIEVSVLSSNTSVAEGVYSLPTTVRVRETDGYVNITITRPLESSGAASTLHYETRAQSARPGEDYIEVASSVSFDEGAVNATVQVQIINDNNWEDTNGLPIPESLILVMIGGCNGAILGQGLATQILIEEDLSDGIYGSIGFENGARVVNESAGTISMKVLRSAGTDGRILVNYTTTDRSATAGIDYIPSQGSLVFEQGETQKIIQVNVVDDMACELQDEAFVVTLTSVEGGAFFSSLTSCEITIKASSDAEVLRTNEGYYQIAHPFKTNPYDTFGFTNSLLRARADLARVKIIIRAMPAVKIIMRREMPAGSMLSTSSSANAFTMDVTGDFEEFVFPITTPSDGLRVQVETFSFQVNPGLPWLGGSIEMLTFEVYSVLEEKLLYMDQGTWWFPPTWPSDSLAYISTRDEDAGVVEFETTLFEVHEDVGEVELTIVRSSNLGTTSVHYSILNGSATSPSDFVHHSGFVQFRHNRRSATITVEVVDDDIYEASNETFYVILDGGCDSSMLGNNANATISIVGPNDYSRGQLQLQMNTSVSMQETEEVVVDIDRSGGADGVLVLTWETQDGSAAHPHDYAAANGTIVFENGATSKPITISLVDDGQKRFVDEVFFVVITSVAAYDEDSIYSEYLSDNSRYSCAVTIRASSTPARGHVTLAKDIAEIAAGSVERQRFEADFVSQLSQALSISPTTLRVLDIRGSSVRVLFEISPSINAPVPFDTIQVLASLLKNDFDNFGAGGTVLSQFLPDAGVEHELTGVPNRQVVTINKAGSEYFVFGAAVQNSIDLSANAKIRITLQSTAPVRLRLELQDIYGATTSLRLERTFGVGIQSHTYDFGIAEVGAENSAHLKSAQRMSLVAMDSIKQLLVYPEPGEAMWVGNLTIFRVLQLPYTELSTSSWWPSTAFNELPADATADSLITFEKIFETVNEDDGLVDISLHRAGDRSREIWCFVATTSRTASAGEDYISFASWVVFGVNETEASFQIEIIDDDEDETGKDRAF